MYRKIYLGIYTFNKIFIKLISYKFYFCMTTKQRVKKDAGKFEFFYYVQDMLMLKMLNNKKTFCEIEN